MDEIGNEEDEEIKADETIEKKVCILCR